MKLFDFWRRHREDLLFACDVSFCFVWREDFTLGSIITKLLLLSVLIIIRSLWKELCCCSFTLICRIFPLFFIFGLSLLFCISEIVSYWSANSTYETKLDDFWEKFPRLKSRQVSRLKTTLPLFLAFQVTYLAPKWDVLRWWFNHGHNNWSCGNLFWTFFLKKLIIA